MSEYILAFDCCGNEISLGQSPIAGKHDDHCLACDTAFPETEIIKRRR